MIFSGARLPDELRIALEEGRLVVFAGAGVSQGKPSRLPGFRGLVEEVGLEFGQMPAEGIPEDRILGNWATTGLKVHAAAAKIVLQTRSKPTRLHQALLELFRTSERVRIVTTNFDEHFSTVARKLFGNAAVREYSGPAVPLGDDFDGIVYLHGSAGIDSNKLVLTDEDFGKAYLTRGWARDFLQSLFRNYTVLFVGYSHRDVVVSYLARGMGESAGRWATVASSISAGDRDNWRHLGIGTIDYPIGSRKGEEHIALTTLFQGWALHESESLLGHAARIKQIAAALPPEKDEAAEYIEYCLSHQQLARDFCSDIRHPAWFGWMKDRGYFKPFFHERKREQMEPHQREIAGWLCTFVRKEHPELLLDIIREGGGTMGADFAETLAREFWSPRRDQPAQPMFLVWVRVLLASGSGILSRKTWLYLLRECHDPGQAGVAVELFELLTGPTLRLSQHWSLFPPEGDDEEGIGENRTKVDWEVQWLSESDCYWLRKSWDHCLEPRLSEIAEELLALATRHLTQAHRMLRDVGKANSKYDPLSWGRSSIAPHSQDARPLETVPGLLIDVARDVLDGWLRTDRVRAVLQIEAWWRRDVPVLKRLALYGVARDAGLAANAKLKWMLDRDLIFAPGMKKEVFDVLKVAYPEASVSVRRRVVARARRGIAGEDAERLEPSMIAYESFNLLQWLKRFTPGCTLIEGALKPIAKRFPNFAVQEHPEFDHWLGKSESIDPRVGFDFDQVLREPPARYLEGLRAANDASIHRDRWSYISNLTELFGRDRAWGLGLMAAAVRREEFGDELWIGMFSAWSSVLESDEDWEWIVDFVESLSINVAIGKGLAYLLSHGFWSREAVRPHRLIVRTERLAGRVWRACKDDSELPSEGYRDWLTTAINHTGGYLADFWIEYLAYVRRRAGSRWKGMPKAYRLRLRQAVEGRNAVCSYARICLNRYSAYLFYWDRDWASEHLVPLFDWKRDATVAQQSWSVFINYRRGSNNEWELEVLDELKTFICQLEPLLKEVAERGEQFGEETLRQLGFHLSRIAMWVLPNPVEAGFFRDFLPISPEPVRVSLARGMEQILEAMDEKTRLGKWDKWLRQYLESRIHGMPVALSYAETGAIVEWCLHLDARFPEAVQLVARLPLKVVFAYSITKDLLEGGLTERFPREACQLCNLALRADEHPTFHGHLEGLRRQFEKHIPRSPLLKEFEEILYERGWRPESGDQLSVGRARAAGGAMPSAPAGRAPS